MKREELNALLADAAAHGGGTFVLNLACDDPIALLNRALAENRADALRSAAAAAAKDMQASKTVLLLPEDLDFAIEGWETVRTARSLVLRETPAALHMLAKGELRACPDERSYPSEGLDGKPAVVADAVTLLAEEGKKALVLVAGDKRTLLEVAVGTPVSAILESNGVEKSGKPILLGGLTGVMVPGDTNAAVEDSADFDLIRPYAAAECMADQAAKLYAAVREETCQKCVLCREGTWHIATIFSDVTAGKASRDSLPMIDDIGPLIQAGAFCSFGQGMARLAVSICAVCKAELETHVLKKQCPAGVCAAFNKKVYVIDPKKCIANGDCVDECPEDAITFKRNFISMIDKAMCSGCGKCAAACEEGAIVVLEGKMRVPDKPTRVGRFK